jgi:hypothetical protein
MICAGKGPLSDAYAGSVVQGLAMSRHWLRLLAVSSLLAASGCAMCQSPYDYCPPTFLGPKCPGAGDPCFLAERAGSILAPAPVAPIGHPTEAGLEVQPAEDVQTPTAGAAETEMPGETSTPQGVEQPNPAPNPDTGAGQPAEIRDAGVARAFRR